MKADDVFVEFDMDEVVREARAIIQDLPEHSQRFALRIALNTQEREIGRLRAQLATLTGEPTQPASAMPAVGNYAVSNAIRTSVEALAQGERTQVTVGDHSSVALAAMRSWVGSYAKRTGRRYSVRLTHPHKAWELQRDQAEAGPREVTVHRSL